MTPYYLKGGTWKNNNIIFGIYVSFLGIYPYKKGQLFLPERKIGSWGFVRPLNSYDSNKNLAGKFNQWKKDLPNILVP